jgi:hypothetical protein
MPASCLRLVLVVALGAVGASGCSGGAGGFAPGIQRQIGLPAPRQGDGDGGKRGDGADPGKSAPERRGDGTPSDGDRAETPIDITGSYLTCMPVAAPTGGDASYGCRLDTRTGAPVRLADVATTWTWELAVSGAQVRQQEPTSGPWAVVFSVAAASADALRAAVAGAGVKLTMMLRPGYEGSPSVITSPLEAVAASGDPNARRLVLPASGSLPAPSVGPAPLPGGVPSMGTPPMPASGGSGAGVAGNGGPIVRFTLAPNGARLEVKASVDGGGARDLAVEALGRLEDLGKSAQIAGTDALLKWRLPLRVTLRRAQDGALCTFTGEIAPQSLRVATTCAGGAQTAQR